MKLSRRRFALGSPYLIVRDAREIDIRRISELVFPAAAAEFFFSHASLQSVQGIGSTGHNLISATAQFYNLTHPKTAAACACSRVVEQVLMRVYVDPRKPQDRPESVLAHQPTSAPARQRQAKLIPLIPPKNHRLRRYPAVPVLT
jgi:hypothetical protein